LVDRNCLFCKIVAREIAGDVVYEDDHVLAFNDISPQAPTHVLIIPKRHVATVNDVADADAAVFGKLVLCARSIAQTRGIDASGYRLICNCNSGGGQTVYHLHLHLLGGRQLRALG
jgi:histidine triad (HIT) family protein